MPNCFTLVRIGEQKPAVLQDVDAELCAQFLEPVHPTRWFNGWYDYIGFGLAMGYDFSKLKTRIADIISESPQDPQHVAFWQRMELIRAYLEKHYVANAWYEVKGFATD